MPEMDGLEATRQIRLLPGKQAVPILAMTANVFDDDRRACIEAGMNDFIAKPIELENLFSTLLRWLSKDGNPAITSATETETPATNTQDHSQNTLNELKNICGLDRETGLRNMRGDITAYLKLLKQFDESHLEEIATLQEKLSDGSTDNVLPIAHNLKGAAGTLGLIDIQQSAAAIEKSLRAGDHSDMKPLIDNLYDHFLQFHRSILHTDNQPPEKVVNTLSDEESRHLLEQLSKLLANGDTKVNQLMNEHGQALQKKYGDHIVEVRQLIDTFNYQKALVLTDRILQQRMV